MRVAPVAAAAVALLAVLSVVSVFIGVADVSPASILAGGADSDAVWLLLASRIPRTTALLLAGASLGVAGLIMQLLVRNRFVEPGTTGTVEFATAGLLVVTILAPGMALIGKMGVAAAFAVAGAALFLLLIRRLPPHTEAIVPLIGIMLGGVVSAAVTFVAYRLELLQTLVAWLTADFSGVLRGRFELLWIAFALTIVALLVADRFTVAGLGDEFATNLGLSPRRIMTIGIGTIALLTAVVVVTVGAIPFLGLVVPNVVRMLVGDHARRSIPIVAVGGALLVVACDIVGRLVRFPYELPVGLVVGIVGAAVFLVLLLKADSRGR